MRIVLRYRSQQGQSYRRGGAVVAVVVEVVVAVRFSGELFGRKYLIADFCIKLVAEAGFRPSASVPIR